MKVLVYKCMTVYPDSDRGNNNVAGSAKANFKITTLYI
jgi:hypothetical protein